jgi:methionine-rich copper-binding protein CopC
LTRLALLLAGVLLHASAAPVLAHSLLLESSPAAHAVLATAPAHVELRFNNRVEKRLSRVTLVGARGERLPATTLTDGAPDRLRAQLPPIPPGEYRLEWRVLSTDGHIVTGTYTFRVSP